MANLHGSLSATQLVKLFEPALVAIWCCLLCRYTLSSVEAGWIVLLSFSTILQLLHSQLFLALPALLVICSSACFAGRNVVNKTTLDNEKGTALAIFCAMQVISALLALLFFNGAHIFSAVPLLGQHWSAIWMPLLGAAFFFALYQGLSLFVLENTSPLQHITFNLLRRFPTVVWSFYVESVSFHLTNAAILMVMVVAQGALLWKEHEAALSHDSKRVLPSVLLPSSSSSSSSTESSSSSSSHGIGKKLSLKATLLGLLCIGALIFGFVYPLPYTSHHMERESFSPPTITIIRTSVDDFGCADLCAIESLHRVWPSTSIQVLTMAQPPFLKSHASIFRTQNFQVPSVLKDTPLERWSWEQVRWKIMSGPLFPLQLQYALQLAALYQSGGAVVSAGTLLIGNFSRSSCFVRPSLRLSFFVDSRTGISDPSLLLAPKHSPLVWRALQHMNATLHSCAKARLCDVVPHSLFDSFLAQSEDKNAVCGHPVIMEHGNTCESKNVSTISLSSSHGAVISFSECSSFSTSNGIHPLSASGAGLRALHGGICSSCHVLPEWTG